MYTQEIILEQITEREFSRLESGWKFDIRRRDDAIYSHLRNPIIETDYERLLFFLLEHPYADQLCVNDQGKWRKKYTRKISDAEVHDMARIAARDMLKTNYLEMKFKGGEDPDEIRAVLKFAEHEGQIIGCEVTVPQHLNGLFTLHYHQPYALNIGLSTHPDTQQTFVATPL